MAAMSRPIEPELLDFAVDLVAAAGEVTLRWFQEADLAVDTKADGTPVTAADRAAERLVRERIADRFPDDGVLGEEEPETVGRSGRRWIVDPIDGTKAFARGVPLYTTLLARDGSTGPAAYARRGLGCWPAGAPARVSTTAALDAAYLMSSSYSHWPDADLLAVK